jgi:hypothetical protein
MKTFFILKSTLVAALLGLTLQTLPAQNFPGAGDFNGSLLKLFGENKAFSAKGDLRALDKSQKETVSTPMDVSVLDDRARFELDLTKMKSANMPAEAIAPLKASGMSRVVTVARSDLKQVLVIYPDAKSMLRMPMEDKDVQSAKSALKLDKTPLGKETIDGHACQKNKITMTDASGTKTEATTWNATDLQDFPIQIQTVDKGNTVVIKFKDVKFNKPDAKLFEAPTGYKEYKNTQEMMQDMMTKMMGGAAQGR